MSQSSPPPGVALRLDAPPALINAIAAAVADELERRGGSTTPSSPWLTVDEAAAYLRCAPQRIYDLVSERKIAPARDGRRLLFRREQLDALVDSHAATVTS
jgi:excisionase family DNA binding protein